MKSQTNLTKSKLICLLAFAYCQLILSTAAFPQGTVINATGKGIAPDTSLATSYLWGKGKMFDGYDPGKEVISKRDMNSKHFMNDDGSYTAVISLGSVHYKDENGFWQEIDNRITETKNNSSYKFCNKANSFKNYFPADLKSNNGVEMEFNEGEVSDWLNPGFCWIDNNGNTISSTNHNDVNGIINENTISYASVFNGTDVKFTQKNDGKKMDIILTDNSLLNSVPTNAKYLAFYETISIPSGWKVVTNNISDSGNSNNNDTIRAIRLYDSKGKAIVEYTTPYFYDNNYLNKTKNRKSQIINPKSQMLYGFYKIEQNKDELIIYTFVPFTWLTSPDREFPITIDPTTTYYPTAVSGWVQCEDFLGGAYYGYPFTGAGACGSCQPGAVSCADPTYGTNRSAFQFDISSLYSACGAAPTVTASTVKFYIWQDMYTTALTVNYYRANTATCGPVPNWGPITCSNVYNLCMTTGSAYVTGVSWPSYTWTAATELGATAHADISAAAASGYFAIGCIGNSGTDIKQADYGGNPLQGTDPPQLTITYSCPCTAPTDPITSGTATICSGVATNISATSTNATTIYWYTGSCGGTQIGTSAPGANYSVSPTTTTTYYARGYNSAGGGCWSAGCGSVTITVTPNNTIALTAGGTQTVCISTPITTTTYSTTGATGATVTGLPAGVTGGWAANVVTISGTPTASGTFNYTVTLTGGCGGGSATGTITVTPNNTITLTAGGTQTVCISTSITTTTYSTTGATGATFSGLPAGVTGSWAANVVTISGTPTASGTFNYTVTLSGGCGGGSATGTITVNPNNTITLISGNNNQTVCVNTPIANIFYTTTGATGATVTDLPAGVTGAWAANVVTISGTPTASGTFSYTVTLSGGCGGGSATGTITVTPNNIITLISGNNNQTVCVNTPIANIFYTTTGATGATVTGLPAGVTGAWAANVVTIGGTPTASGTFPYTVTLTGGCGTVTATGTITVNPNNTITLTSAAGTDAQTLCINTPITTITYSTTGATGATITGLPAGVSGSWAAGVVIISGTPTVSGTLTYTITLTGGCP